MNITGIYKIVNKIDGKYYVGSTNNFHKRWNFGHKLPLIENRHDNSKLQNAWNKYGQDNFDCVLLETIEIDKLLSVEQKYLDIAKTEIDKCYNLSFIAGKVEMTSEIRQKLSKAHTGKKLSDETKKKMSQSRQGFKQFLGHHHRPDTIKKLSELNKGKIISEKQKQQISNTLMGHSVTDETKAKLRLANKGCKPWNTGKKLSEETRLKIAESHRKRNQLKKSVQPTSLCPDNIHPLIPHQDTLEILQNKTTEHMD